MKNRTFRLWLCACLAWLCVIYGHSLMPASVSDGESRGVLSCISRIFPWLTHHLLRKIAHFSSFAILGTLLTGTLLQTKNFHPAKPIAASLLAAFIDETIQLFVPGRSGQISDMWIDLSGAICGALLTWLLLRRLKRRRV